MTVKIIEVGESKGNGVVVYKTVNKTSFDSEIRTSVTLDEPLKWRNPDNNIDPKEIFGDKKQ